MFSAVSYVTCITGERRKSILHTTILKGITTPNAFSILQLRISCCLQVILRPILTPIVPIESGDIFLQENRVRISAISCCQEICSSKLSKNPTRKRSDCIDSRKFTRDKTHFQRVKL